VRTMKLLIQKKDNIQGLDMIKINKNIFEKMKIVSNKRKSKTDISQPLKFIAYNTYLNSLVTKQIVLTAKERDEARKRKNQSFISRVLSELTLKNIFIILPITLAIITGFSHWNYSIITAQINEIKNQKKADNILQDKYTRAVIESRNLILNQYDMCNFQKIYPGKLMTERRNSIGKITILSPTVRNIYGKKVYSISSNIISRMYGIDDVCSIDNNAFDNYIESSLKTINNIINARMDEESRKINALIKKRHKIDIAMKI
jgi:hypothetical protein